MPHPEPGPSSYVHIKWGDFNYFRIAFNHFSFRSEEKPLLQGDSSLTDEVDHILEYKFWSLLERFPDSLHSSVWPMPPRTFPSLGWTEHVLPSSAYYYSHAETRTVTDIDLRNEKKLAAVTSYLQEKRTPKASTIDLRGKNGETIHSVRTITIELPIEESIDLWLRDANTNSKAKDGTDWVFMPMKNWVLHASRAVTFDSPSERGHALEDLSDDDRMIWGFFPFQYFNIMIQAWIWRTDIGNTCRRILHMFLCHKQPMMRLWKS